MKALNNVKLASSFREISNTLDIVSGVIKLFVIVLMVLQGVMIIKNTKESMQ